eukprot:Em0234g9a
MRKDGNGIGSNKVEIQTPIEFSRKLLACPGPSLEPKGNSMMAKWLQGNLRAQWAARTMGNVQAKPLFNGNLELGRVEMETKTVTDSHDAA